MKIRKRMIITLLGIIVSVAACSMTAFAAEEDVDPNAFTPDGSGTVIDHVTEENGKEFFTIQTEDGNIFYLIVDRLRETDNVYFLNAVTESDLMALAEKSGKPIAPDVATEENPHEEEPEKKPEQEVPAASAGLDSNTATMIYAGIAVAVVGGIGFYLKIVKPKKRGQYSRDDEFDEYEDSGDEDEDHTADDDSDDS